MPTYNIVEEGADNTGSTAIDSTLAQLAGENTTIVFPPGTYKLNKLVVLSGVNNLTLTAPQGARLVPGKSGDDIRWIDVYSQGFVLDGFELDMRDTPVPPFVRMNSKAGNWELKRLVTRGKVRAATDSNVGSLDSTDARTYFRLSAAEGTRGLLQDCYFHEGACEPDEASNRRAILVESGKGELVFNRCWFELWAENTVYAKKPEGPIKLYNCFLRNTQVGIRLGGNSEVRNCVSIKDDKHPIQAWSGGALQRGVNAEAVAPADPKKDINSYAGTLTIADSDFYHRYFSGSCGGAITAPAPCERIDIQNVRVSYKSEKWHDAIYTSNGENNAGEPLNLEYLQLKDIQVRNDHPSDYLYAVSIGQAPDEWGTVSGVLGGDSSQTDSDYVRSRVTTNGDPTPPNTTPPLPSPPSLGEVPMQSAQLVRIDNTSNESATTYQITADTSVLPAGDGGATVAMDWGPDDSPVRQPNTEEATGTVPPGEIHAYYVSGGIVSTTADGPAAWSVDGNPFQPGDPLATGTLSTDQPGTDTWHQIDPSSQSSGVVIAKPLSHNGPQPAHVRLQNTMESGFEYQLEEWGYLDGWHTTETFHTLAMQPAEHQIQLRDGTSYQVKAGTVSASDSSSTHLFGESFDTNQPVVLAQAQTYNGHQPIVTRISDVSRDSFDVRVQEDEANDAHLTETVGYIALQQGTGYLDGKPFEVQRTEEMSANQWTQISFEQQYESPRFIAGMQTFNGADTAALRYRNLSSTGVEVKIEEEQSADSETTYWASEAIGYAVFEGATLSTDTLSSDQPDIDTWHQVDSSSQSSGVVIAKPLSHNGPQPAHVRLQNTMESGFEYQLEEWGYLDGWHTTETFHTLAMQPTEQELLLSDGTSYQVKAGTVSASDSSSTHLFGESFDTNQPVVLAQAQTYNGHQPIVTRISDVSRDSFDVRVQEDEANDAHLTETVGYIALQQEVGQFNVKPFEVQRTEEMSANQWTQISFEQQYESPRFIAGMQTFNGADTAALRYRNLSSTGVEVKIEEEQSADSETTYWASEAIGYAVFEME